MLAGVSGVAFAMRAATYLAGLFLSSARTPSSAFPIGCVNEIRETVVARAAITAVAAQDPTGYCGHFPTQVLVVRPGPFSQLIYAFSFAKLLDLTDSFNNCRRQTGICPTP